jgi:hypothetical protein
MPCLHTVHSLSILQLAGTFRAVAPRDTSATYGSYVLEAGRLIGTVLVYPSTPFGLQARGISMLAYWDTVRVHEEGDEEEIAPKEEVRF